MDYPDSQHPVVLFIDDDQTLHVWAQRSLQELGFKIISSFDGNEGVESFQQYTPNVVLIDIEMPNMGGIEVCSLIRNLPTGSSVPLIMMTGTEDHQKITQAYASGATDFVVKPINWIALGHRLQHMLKESNMLLKMRQRDLRLSKAKKMARLGEWEWRADTNTVFWSDEIYSMLELNKQDYLPSIDNFKCFIQKEDLLHVKHQLRKAIFSKKDSTVEFRVITSNQNVRFLSQQIESIENQKAHVIGLLGTVQDITERKSQENNIRQLAYYDEITQLPNRTFFLKFLSKTIDLAQRNTRTFAVLFLDLDGFKGINDTYGHQAGDLLLREIANRLTIGLRCSDLASRYFDHFDHKVDVARLGGDEFTILLNDLARPEDAAKVAERIEDWIKQPVLLGDRLAHVGVSMGIAIYPQDGEDSETLLKSADIAMYHAKKLGKGHYQYFHASMALKAKKRLEMESHMHLAVARDELRLYYQPIVDITSGRLIGAEALMRWQNSHLGFLPPNDFISLAEENGVINQFGEWAIRQVCRQHKAWQRQGLEDLAISVNLSSLQFNQISFIPMVAGIIDEFKINPELLTFELTETMIMADTDNILKKLTTLKDMGFKLALDDFGTGYSSLRYLNRFPLDILKIDGSFIRELPESDEAAAIVNAILVLAKSLNLMTIAEGVESSGQRDYLQATTCTAVQGYYYSKPLPVTEFQRYWDHTNTLYYKSNRC